MASILNRFTLVGGILIALIIGATFLIIQMQRSAAIDAFRIATTNLGNGMSQQTTQSIASVDRVLSEIQNDLASTPDATAERIKVAMARKSTFDSLVEQRKHLLGVVSLSLVDSAGLIANDSRKWPPAAVDVSDQDFFVHLSTDHDPIVFVGGPVKDPGSGAWIAPLARRVDDTHGNFAGLVVGEISLSEIQAFYQLAMPVRRSVYVLRRDGVILVRYPQREDEIGKQIPERSPWYAMVAKGGGAYNAPGYFDSASVIASVHPLRNLPLVLEASVTESDSLSQWYQQRLWIFAGCAGSIICVILLLHLFAGQYRRIKLSELSLARKNADLDIAHQQLDATLASLSQGVCFFNDDKVLLVSNQRYGELYGLENAAVRPGVSIADICQLCIAAGSFPKLTVGEYIAKIDAILKDGKPHDEIFELADGRVISCHFQPLPDSGCVVTHEDITKRREAEEKIVYLAWHDVLTGLANRALFQERLDQALALAKRGNGFAVLFIDLDGFKAVNDTYGHPLGDSLIRAVAGRLREALRDGDTIARLGGDEFAILQLGVAGQTETTTVARRIVEAISKPFELDGHQVTVGASIGIAMAPADGVDPVELMKHADLALYRSKHDGRGIWRFFGAAVDG